MRENWARISDLCIASEGGYTNDSRDPGNWTGGAVGKGELKGTKYGIAANTYGHLDIKNLTRDQAVAIYRADYWDKISGDRLPSGLDYSVFDFAINSGVRRAAEELQRLIPGVTVDGIIGSATINAIEGMDIPDLIRRYNDARLAFMKRLKVWPTYKNGWTKRVNKVRAISLNMAKGAEPVSTGGTLESAKARPENITVTSAVTDSGESQTLAGGSVGVSGATVAEVAQSITETQEKLEPLTYYLEVAKYLFLFLAVTGFGISIYLMIKRKRQQV